MEISQRSRCLCGAPARIRTADLLITNQQAETNFLSLTIDTTYF